MRWIVLLAAFAAPAAAEIRPVPRPMPEVAILSPEGSVQVAGATTPGESTRPMRRVEEEVQQVRTLARAIRAPVPRVDAAGDVRISERPALRPHAVLRAAMLIVAEPKRAAAPGKSGTVGGGICGRDSIRGAAIAPVRGPGGCGIGDAVRVRQVSGITLSRPARIDCTTAVALDDWVRNGVIPTIGNRGGGPVALQVAASYSCRTRNSQTGAKMSEHALGHAIDIAAITLADGGAVTVATDWNRGPAGQMLKALWRSACGTFGTVLGPESDRFHQDHLHFDTARYRSGSYCR